MSFDQFAENLMRQWELEEMERTKIIDNLLAEAKKMNQTELNTFFIICICVLSNDLSDEQFRMMIARALKLARTNSPS